MASYIKSTDFSVKDDLITGDPDKRIKGTEIDEEFDAIAVAVNTKADLFSPAFLGVPTAATASPGVNNTQLATTAFVNTASSSVVSTAITNERTATATLTNKTLTDPVITNANATITSGSITGITDLAVADGGTGRSSLTADNVILGDGTNAVKFVAPGTNGNILTSNGTTWTSAAAPTGITATTGSAPYYAARAWAHINSSGSLIQGANISSTSGTSPCTINLTTAMPDANYVVVGLGFGGSSFTRYLHINSIVSSSQFRVQNGDGLTNPTCVAVFR
jgi:hypothetical protein